MGTLSLIKSIAKNIKYQELPELIGKIVTINSIATIPTDIQRDLSLSANTRWVTKEEKFLRRAMAKQGLIDIDYRLHAEAISSPETGMELVRRFHLVQNIQDSEDELELDLTRVAISFLEDIAEELAAKQVYCKAFLETEHPMGEEAIKTFFQYKQGDAFPDDYFPRQFVVKDAALSNTSHIWMFKHFYW
jgi:hypothetical protein